MARTDSLTPVSGEQISIRRAQESDRRALELIAARTWEGHDYLPEVISDWLADHEGEFVVATLGAEGRVVGTGKLTRLGTGEWWMEGMRVDPDMYGKGIGGILHRYAVTRAHDLADDGGLLRFSTDDENTAVHRMAAETGFALVATFRRYLAGASAAQGGADSFSVIGPDEIGPVRAYLESSPTYAHAQRSAVMRRRWSCRLITDDRLREWAANNMLLGWHGRRGDRSQLDGVMIAQRTEGERGTEHGPEWTVLYLDAIPGGLALMAQAARGLAAARGCSTLWHMLLARPERLVAIEQAGWRRPNDDSGRACLFSRLLTAPDRDQHMNQHTERK